MSPQAATATPAPHSSMRDHIPTHCLAVCPEKDCNSPDDQDKFECVDCVACIMPCGDSCADDEHCDDTLTDSDVPVCITMSTVSPTTSPTLSPTLSPTQNPTKSPTLSPTLESNGYYY